MAGFTELIKNYEKIRSFVRDFFVFGFRGRSDYESVSARSYDNERRRIQSYLNDYIIHNRSGVSKTVSISSDTTAKTINPLFKVWETKSFTKNDMFLHFVLLDTLQDSCLSAPQLAEIIADEYISKLNSEFFVDAMTVRNKLKEYTELGLLEQTRDGRSLCYKIKQDIKLSPQLIDALQFYQNIMPCGFFVRTVTRGEANSFIYRQIFFAQTLDDAVVKDILGAIMQKRSIFVKHIDKVKHVKTSPIVPIKVLSNTRTGRRYLIYYTIKRSTFATMRIDYIKSITLSQPVEEFDAICSRCEKCYEKTFALVAQQRDLKQLRLVLRIDEQKEHYVLTRLKREGQQGVITKLTENTFEYKTEIADTLEMVPWLRTFIGRIISIEGTQMGVISQFKRDIKTMAAMYGENDV